MNCRTVTALFVVIFITLSIPSVGISDICPGGPEICASASSGDHNCDGLVDLFDIAMLANNWLIHVEGSDECAYDITTDNPASYDAGFNAGISSVDPGSFCGEGTALQNGTCVSTSGETRRAVLIAAIGLRENTPEHANTACLVLENALQSRGIQGACVPVQVRCSPTVSVDPTVKACWDLHVLLPVIPARLVANFEAMVSRGGLPDELRDHQALLSWNHGALAEANAWNAVVDLEENFEQGPGPDEETSILAFVRLRGYAWGGNIGMLLSARRLLEISSPGADLMNTTAFMLSASAPTIDIDASTLLWTASTYATAGNADYSTGCDDSGLISIDDPDSNCSKDDLFCTASTETGFLELEVFAPEMDFCGDSGSSGTWALIGVRGRMGDDGYFKCLKGKFRNLRTGSTTTVSSGDCSQDPEKKLTLAEPYYATGVGLAVSGKDLEGITLTYGTPNTTIDRSDPDFLTGVSATGTTTGESPDLFAPDTSVLDDDYPYVVVGIGVSAEADGVTALRVYLGTLTAEAPESTDIWNGYTIAELDAAMPEVLNTVYAALTSNLSFELYDDCPSTIPSIEFCDNFSASSSYDGGSTWDDVCGVTCDAYYESCRAALDACRVGCCYGCLWGKWCKCASYDTCSDEKDNCYDGCTQVITGSTEVNVKRVTGLESLVFTDATIPYVTSSDELAVTVALEIPAGELMSVVYWELCQSGICVSDTTSMSTSTITAFATGKLYTANCANSDGAGIFLSVDDVEVISMSSWDINSLVEDILSTVDDSLDWLAENISDIFDTSLSDDYTAVTDELFNTLEAELNTLLIEAPIAGCD